MSGESGTSSGTSVDVRIRPARAEDAEWIVPLGPRMHEFGPPPWRDVRVMDDAVAAQWARELASPTAGSAFLVAEDALGSPVGFVWLRTERDYFIDMPVGHVADIAVTKAGEGRGIGRALLDAATGGPNRTAIRGSRCTCSRAMTALAASTRNTGTCPNGRGC